jgi:hypothetical protein
MVCAKLMDSRSALRNAPPADVTASTTRADDGKRYTPGEFTAPATWTVMMAGDIGIDVADTVVTRGTYASIGTGDGFKTNQAMPPRSTAVQQPATIRCGPMNATHWRSRRSNF